MRSSWVALMLLNSFKASNTALAKLTVVWVCPKVWDHTSWIPASFKIVLPTSPTTNPTPAGVGLVIGDVGKTILKLAGIHDVWSQSFGQTQTTVNFANAVFDALKELSKVKASAEDLKKMGVNY